MKILIDYDSKNFYEDYMFLERIIYSILENEDFNELENYIFEVTDDCFEIDDDLQIEITRMYKLLEENYRMLQITINNIRKFIPKDFLIEGLEQMGMDIVLDIQVYE